MFRGLHWCVQKIIAVPDHGSVVVRIVSEHNDVSQLVPDVHVSVGLQFRDLYVRVAVGIRLVRARSTVVHDEVVVRFVGFVSADVPELPILSALEALSLLALLLTVVVLFVLTILLRRVVVPALLGAAPGLVALVAELVHLLDLSRWVA